MIGILQECSYGEQENAIQIIVVNKAINILSVLIIMLTHLHKHTLQWNNGNPQNFSTTKVRL